MQHKINQTSWHVQIARIEESMRLLMGLIKLYRKTTKISDTRKICCNHPKIRTTWLYNWEMNPKDIDGIENSVDPDQTAPIDPDQTAPLGAV